MPPRERRGLCRGLPRRVGVVVSRSLRVLFLGSHGSLEHVNVAVRTCPVLCGVPRGFGGDSLPHIPATRAI